MMSVVLVILCAALVLVLTMLYKSGALEDGMVFTLAGGLVGGVLTLIDSRWRKHSHSTRQPSKAVGGGSTGASVSKTQQQMLADIRAEIVGALR